VEQHVYWGDLHTHLEDFAAGDEIMRAGRENIDFYAVLMYPFVWDIKNGVRVESIGHRPEYTAWWEQERDLARQYHEPGRFVTFLGYEWNGDRRRFGDHNVIYRDDDQPYVPLETLPELYAFLRGRPGIAIPHHTGYLVGQRGKDWDFFDEALSPVMEVFSGHGSSEGCNTPLGMEKNSSMGPRTSGGTFHDALARGYRVGVIASNDGPTLPGRWGLGRAAVWAPALTREAVWEAILARRTYAVTGDRIVLDFRMAGQPMGAIWTGTVAPDAAVAVVGGHAIDRIELLRNGRVVDTYCHSGRWEDPPAGRVRAKMFIEAGWGPAADYGLRTRDWHWACQLDVAGGRLCGVERCFFLLGGGVRRQDETSVAWEMTTAGRVIRNPPGMTQGIIAEIEGEAATRLTLRAEGLTIQRTLGETLRESALVPLLDESARHLRDGYGLDAATLGNLDSIYHNARKIKWHQAIPEAGYRAQHTFRGLRLAPGRNAFHVRVSQLNGQMAWSSPIWIDRP